MSAPFAPEETLICSATFSGFASSKLSRSGYSIVSDSDNGVWTIEAELSVETLSNRAGALEAFKNNKSTLSRVESVLVDGGYTGEPFANATDEILGASVQVAKRSELHTFAVIPQRWVVERSFAWLENCRRLWKNTERKLNTSLQFTHVAFLVLLLRRL